MEEIAGKKEYEISYLLTPEITEEKVDFEAGEIARLLGENGGETVQLNPLEKKRLAYPVKKQNQAYFGIASLAAGQEDLDKIKKALSLNKKVLRFLILNKAKKANVRPAPAPDAANAPAKISPSFDQKLEDILKAKP